SVNILAEYIKTIAFIEGVSVLLISSRDAKYMYSCKINYQWLAFSTIVLSL
ncbi:hypothetical protein L9F63_010427, partial [Diploptera punctata]